MFFSNREARYGQLSAALALCLLLGATTTNHWPEQIKTEFATPYLHTEGNKIVDRSGATVAFSGLNWFGFETANNAPHGLWSRNWEGILDQIKALGYNTIRLPFSNAVLQPGVKPTGIDYSQNPDLEGLTSLEVMDKIIAGAGARGIWVILDNHRSTPGGGPEANGLWYTDDYPESRWIADWKRLVARYKDSPAVIGVDLRNEPHGACWGCGEASKDWRLAAERGGNAVLAVNPDLLIIVEGVGEYDGQPYWWGGNLLGARAYPVRLDVPGRLVYSAHDYPASVHPQPWFSDPNYPDNLASVWDQHWGYLVREKIAPVLVGEFGTRYETETDRQWLKAMQRYIQQTGLSWTFWSFNPNSGDTGGLLHDDWTSVHAGKQAILAGIQYPSSAAVIQPPAAAAPAPRPTPKAEVLAPFVLEDFGADSLDGWNIFKDSRSAVAMAVRPVGEAGSQALKVSYSLSSGGWGGVERIFAQPQDWSRFTGLEFRLYGTGSGNRIRVELLDNRSAGTAGDTAERFESQLMDDFSGWRTFSLPWNAFQRREDWQPAGAPDNDLGLREVWGFNFAPVNGSGEFQVEQVELTR